MEKGKNRTDLLAAGRKKLQQFRQKKDYKTTNSSSNSSSSSQAKSSQKPGKHSESMEADSGQKESSVDMELVNTPHTVNAVDADTAACNQPVLPLTTLLVKLAEDDDGSNLNVSEEQTPEVPAASSFTKRMNTKREDFNDLGDPPDSLLIDRRNGSCEASNQDDEYSVMKQPNRDNSSGCENFDAVTSESGVDEATTTMAIEEKDVYPKMVELKLDVAVDKGALPHSEEGASKVDCEIPLTVRSEIDEDIAATVHQRDNTDQEDDQILIMDYWRNEPLFALKNHNMDANMEHEDTVNYLKVKFDDTAIADTLFAEAVHGGDLAVVHGEGPYVEKCLKDRSTVEDTAQREKQHAAFLANVGSSEDVVGEKTKESCRCTKQLFPGEGTCLRSPVVEAGLLIMADEVEILQRHLYLNTIMKDFFNLLITEQVDKHVENELNLSCEVSRLLDFVPESQKKKSGISEELDKCRTELELMASTKKDLENQCLSATGEINMLSARILELQNEMVQSQNTSKTLSAELSSYKNVIEKFQTENYRLNEEILSGREEIEMLKAERVRSTLQVEELHARMHNLLSELELSKKESELSSIELADCKAIMVTLHMENSNLTMQILSGTEDLNRLKTENDALVYENKMLVSALADQKDQLAVALDKMSELDKDFKETVICIKNVAEENAYFFSYLDAHKIKVKGLEHDFQELRSQAQKFGSLAKMSIDSMVNNCKNIDSCTKLYSVGKIVLEDSQLEPTPFKQIDDNFPHKPSSIDAMRANLVEAEKILENLEKAILSMHAQQMSYVKSESRMASSGVSKLIQAFESKASSDNVATSDEMPLVEGEKSSTLDLYNIVKEQACILKATLKQIALDAEMHKQDNIHIARKFKVESETLTIHKNKLDTTTEELDGKFTEYKLGIDTLHSQLENTWQDANDEARRLTNQVETIEKEVSDMVHALGKEVNIMKDVILEACQKLDAYSGFAPVDILESDSQLTMSVNAVAEVIEDLKVKLEATCLDRDRTHDLYNELYSNYVGQCETQSLTDRTLYRMYGNIVKLIKDYSYNSETPAADFCENSVKLKDEVLQKPSLEDFERLIEQLNKLLNDTCLLYSAKAELESEIALRNRDVEGLREQCAILTKNLDDKNSTVHELRSLIMKRDQDYDELRSGCFELVQEAENWKTTKSQNILPEVGNIGAIIKSDKMEIVSIKQVLVHLGASVTTLLKMYGEAADQLNLSKESLLEVIFNSECPSRGHSEPLHLLIKQDIFPRIVELIELKKNFNWLTSKNVEQEKEVQIFKKKLGRVEEDLENVRSELNSKVSELEQSEQRLSSVREKLGIAVSKGKGLVMQRDSLKQSLTEKSSELEAYSQELQSKEAKIFELETKLKSSEADRVEALESELSYIRNSATAFRDSFLQKDSILQKIEEVMEELDFPEDFHSKDTVEKVEWLAKSVTKGTAFQPTDWEQRGFIGGSQTDPGLEATDVWKDGMQPNPVIDDLKRRYEELLNRFYGLAEQNEMLEQSLIERNGLVQRWENVLDKIDFPLQLKALEPEDRLDWLGSRLFEVQQDRDSLLTKIDDLEVSTESLLSDLKASKEKISDLDAILATIQQENQSLSESLSKLRFEHLEVSDKAAKNEVEKHTLQKEITRLQESLTKQSDCRFEMQQLHDLLHEALLDNVNTETHSETESITCLGSSLRKLVDEYKVFSSEKHVHAGASGVPNYGMTADASCVLNYRMSEEQNMKELLSEKEQNLLSLMAQLEEISGSMAVLGEERDMLIEKCNMHNSDMEALMLQKEILEKERETALSKYQSLVAELESMTKQRDMLQDQLIQEEHRSVSIREKLNVAVRKGKGLVQQRDNLKQTVEEMEIRFSNLQEELNQHIGALQSENSILKNTLSENEIILKDHSKTLNSFLSALYSMDLGSEANIVDPVKKLELIGKLCDDLRAAVISSDNEATKSKRAAELLVAELNEVQERADNLQEYLGKAEAALAQYSKERDIAEAEKRNAVSQHEQFMVAHNEEMKKQLHSILELKDGIFELREGSLSLSKHLADVFSKNVDLLHGLKSNVDSTMKLVDGSDMADSPLLMPADFLSHDMLMKDASFSAYGSSEVDISEDADPSFVTESIQVAGTTLHACIKEFTNLKEELHAHSFAVYKQFKDMHQVMELSRSTIASRKASAKYLERDIKDFEMILQNKDSELNSIRSNISLLYEACRRTILELETRRTQVVVRPGAFTLPSWVHESGPMDGQTSVSEEFIRMVADYLLMTVNHSTDVFEKAIEEKQVELKATLSNFQRELHEKDVQHNRIHAELVSQIREAEAVAKKFSANLDSAKVQVKELESHIEEMQNNEILSEMRATELVNLEVSVKEYELKLKSLTDSLAGKDQEIEGLMQALDEEESQMELLQSRNQELEQTIQQNHLALENLEISRAKALSKLSTTLTRFDELHHLSENLLAEVENLQSQLQERDSEISFLRQEVARCTDDLLAKQESNKKILNDLHEVQMWMDAVVLRLGGHKMHLNNGNNRPINLYIEYLDRQIPAVIAELEDLRIAAQKKDALLDIEKGRVNELSLQTEALESSLREKKAQIEPSCTVREPEKPMPISCPDSLEVEPTINRRSTLGSSPLARGGRRANNDQSALAIDIEQENDILVDEDDDKAHGFKSLTTSKIVPRATRPVADRIDGLWVSIERLLMRQPTLRLGLIVYWILLHSLLAASI